MSVQVMILIIPRRLVVVAVGTLELRTFHGPGGEVTTKVRVFIDWLVERIGPKPYWDRGLLR